MACEDVKVRLRFGNKAKRAISQVTQKALVYLLISDNIAQHLG